MLQEGEPVAPGNVHTVGSEERCICIGRQRQHRPPLVAYPPTQSLTQSSTQPPAHPPSNTPPHPPEARHQTPAG